MSKYATKVVAVGTKVEMGTREDPIQGVITALMIEQNLSVSYRVVWWEGRTRRHEWIVDQEAWLATDDPPQRMAIGFVTDAKD